MKRFLILIMSILCIIFLASCDIEEQMAQISDNLKNQIIDMAGQFIEKNTESDIVNDKPSDTPDNVPGDIPDDTPGNVPDDTISDGSGEIAPDVPSEPETPEVPDYILLDRVKYPINKYTGLTITKQQGISLADNDYKHNLVYGYGRLEIALDEALNANPVTYFSISGIESSVLLGLDLSLINKEGFSEITASVHEFANKYCLSTNALSNLRRIEIGTNPDTKISAEDYALLLNTIYDDNCMQNGEKVGTTFINPEIRLITGKMSINSSYIRELMNEIELIRDDEFLPIGGWSFSVSTDGKNPEDAFLNNEALNELISYRNENYNTIEIYLSDFGWDTVNTESTNYVAPTDNYTSEEIQAMYILRAYLILSGMDVDKASYGTLNDTDTNGEGIIKADGTKKLSYSMLEYFKAKMNGMYLTEIVSNGENDVYSYKFENDKGKTIYAIWSTSETEYELTDISGEITISKYDKTEIKYIDTNQTVENTLPLSLTELVTFVECNG